VLAIKPHVVTIAVAGLVALSLSAAGQSLQAPPPGDELDVTSYEVVYRLPGMDKVEVRTGLPFVAAGGAELHLDLYLPAARPAGVKVPVVVFVNGVGLPALKDWTIYRSWGRLVAAAGMAAVTFEARRPTVDADIAALFAALGEKGASWSVDPDRVAMWSCSGNVPAALRYAMGTAPGVRALVAYYGASVVDRIRADLPVLLVRAGRDNAELLDGEALLAGGAIGANAPWTVLDVPAMPHAFDALVDDAASRDIVRQTVEFLAFHLHPQPAAAAVSPGRQALTHVFASEIEQALPFFTRLLEEHPEDRGLLVRVAGYELAGRPADAARHFERAIALGETSPTVLYNTACAWAKAGEPERALDALDRAIAGGFADRTTLAGDEDLVSLRSLPRFAAILDRLGASRPTPAPGR
jgi:tetratricopeptide (TPR) repeat protein